MNSPEAVAAPGPETSGLPVRLLHLYRDGAGLSLIAWAVIALLNFAAQIIFRRELAPGEFGTLNTCLGLIGLITVPILAVPQGFAWYLAREHAVARAERIEALRGAALLVTETLAAAWAVLSLGLLFLVLPLLYLPRSSLNFFTMLNVIVALGGGVSGAICQDRARLKLWAGFLIAASLVRVVAGTVLTAKEPWAEAGLATILLAGVVTLIPVVHRHASAVTGRINALRAALDPEFLLHLGATISVITAIFLFTSADRIVGQSWFGTPMNNNIHYVDWRAFDAYQTAGLLGRALLWGTQPLLVIMFAQRARLSRTTAASLTWFWIYLGALFGGAILLGLLHEPLSRLFCGDDFQLTADLVLILCVAMLPLGLLQGIGLFALASRRFHECFILGGLSVAYSVLLYLVGRHPEVMPAYMFGGGLVALMAVLFVGVVRWGRKQP